MAANNYFGFPAGGAQYRYDDINANVNKMYIRVCLMYIP